MVAFEVEEGGQGGVAGGIALDDGEEVGGHAAFDGGVVPVDAEDEGFEAVAGDVRPGEFASEEGGGGLAEAAAVEDDVVEDAGEAGFGFARSPGFPADVVPEVPGLFGGGRDVFVRVAGHGCGRLRSVAAVFEEFVEAVGHFDEGVAVGSLREEPEGFAGGSGLGEAFVDGAGDGFLKGVGAGDAFVVDAFAAGDGVVYFGGDVVAAGFEEEVDGEGEFAFFGVGVEGFARAVFVADHVEAVVVDLVGDAEEGAHAVEFVDDVRRHAGDPRGAFHGGGEEGGCFFADEFVVVRPGHVEVEEAGGLFDFALANVADDLGDHAAEFGVAEFGAHDHGVGEHDVAEEDGEFVAPEGVGCGFVAPGVGMVEDVVMDEGGHVDEFEHGGEGDVLGFDAAGGTCGEEDEAGTDEFALRFADLGHVVLHMRFEAGDLCSDLFLHEPEFVSDEVKLLFLAACLGEERKAHVLVGLAVQARESDSISCGADFAILKWFSAAVGKGLRVLCPLLRASCFRTRCVLVQRLFWWYCSGMEFANCFEDGVELACRKDPRFKADAYDFLRKAMDVATERYACSRSNKHLSAEELYIGCCAHALEEYGPLAKLVLQSWGVRSSEDVGCLVYNLIEVGIFGKQKGDSQDEFAGLPSMEKILDEPYCPEEQDGCRAQG